MRMGFGWFRCSRAQTGVIIPAPIYFAAAAVAMIGLALMIEAGAAFSRPNSSKRFGAGDRRDVSVVPGLPMVFLLAYAVPLFRAVGAGHLVRRLRLPSPLDFTARSRVDDRRVLRRRHCDGRH